MSQFDESFVARLTRAISSYPKVQSKMQSASEWLGLTHDESQLTQDCNCNECLRVTEPENPKKYSFSWSTKTLKPANKILYSVMGLYLVLSLLHYSEYLPTYPRYVPDLLILIAVTWLAVRWLAKKSAPGSELRESLQLKATGMFWWIWAAAAHHLLSLLVTSIVEFFI